MVSQWPKADDSLNFPAEEQEMEEIMAAIRAVRNRRSEMNVAPSRKAALFIQTKYVDTFHPITADARAALYDAVKEAYEQALEQKMAEQERGAPGMSMGM